MHRMVGHYQTLVAAVVGDPEARLSTLPLLTAAEVQQLAVEWNDSATVVEGLDADFSRHFAAVAAGWGGRVAAICGEEKLTYAELDRRSSRVAAGLLAEGAEPGALVPLYAPRGLDFLAGILGAFKAGAAYLPLDPDHPARRTEQVVTASGARHLLVARSLVPRMEEALRDLPLEARPRLLRLENLLESELPEKPLPTGFPAQGLAYVIFTSGSTGAPKGAMVEHRGMINHLWAKVVALGLDADDVIVQNASQSFDISVWQFLAALLVGGRVHIASGEVVHDPLRLVADAENAGATVLETVPSLLRAFLDEVEERPRSRPALPRLRWMVVTGEALPPDVCRRWLALYPGIPMVNAYGPTECSDDVTHDLLWVGDRLPEWVAPIGRPVINLRLYTLDRRQRPVPIGVAGELYVGGTGVGRGYLEDGGRTAEVFLPDPFSPSLDGGDGRRLYRTGDLVRLRPDGRIEFLGRIDHQVKVRGHRIELGEIESALAWHPAVHQAVVLAREDVPGNLRLVAYVVTSPEGAPDPALLRAHLGERLPDYMLPADWIFLPVLPLTANGKIDRRALPAPERRSGEEGCSVSPRSPVEELLAEIWASVLRLERVGLHDDFFDLGGHSLLATQVVARVRAVFGVELPLRLLFEGPTVSALAVRIDAMLGETRDEAPAILPVPRDVELPLSFAQERLWFLAQIGKGAPNYNVPLAVELRGPLSCGALALSLREIASRHEALRTSFPTIGGRPAQVIRPELALDPPVVDLEALPPGRAEREASVLAGEEAVRPFDLARGPLARVTLVRLSPERHVALLTLHHIVADGWSMGLLIRELGALYPAFAAGRPSPLTPLPVQYADFAVWQRRWLSGEVLERQVRFWRERLAGAPPLLELPTDRPRKPGRFRGAESGPLRLDERSLAGLRDLGRRHGATLFMTLLAVYGAVLHRWTGEDDLPVGTPIANRNQAETEGLIGFFVNILVLRVRTSAELAFSSLLLRVRELTLEAYAHQDLPFEKLVQELQPERTLAHTPLFQVLLSLQNAPASTLELPDLTLAPLAARTDIVKFDLTLDLQEQGGGLAGGWGYNRELFDGATIERFSGHLRTLLAGILDSADVPLSDLPLLTLPELHQLRREWSPPAEIAAGAPVHERFSIQAERTPNALAVLFAGKSLSFAELDQRSAALARTLRALGVRSEVRVGLLLERSLDLPVAILGIWKAGGAYVPLDPGLPAARLALMIDDSLRPESGLTLVVTRRGLPESVPGMRTGGVRWVHIDDREPAGAPAGAIPPGSPEDLAYLIYTSGSSGTPKAVLAEHGNLAHTLTAVQRSFGFQPGDRMPCIASFTFDIFLFELMAPLLGGAAVEILWLKPTLDLARLVAVLPEMTLLHAVPAIMRQIVEAALRRGGAPSLRRVFVGGDAVPPDLLARMAEAFPAASLTVLYGPTEASILATCHAVDEIPAESRLPLGRPLPATEVGVFDRAQRPSPIGVPGELWLGGDGVTRGYLGRPELTADRYVPRDGGGRWYRTGDLVRWRSGGELEFLGRTDHQVKVRGFRIEPGEIETVLAAHPAVGQAAVLAIGDRLAAFLVPCAGAAIPPGGLADYLRERLPDYMIPDEWRVLSELPLTAHGKVDLRSLADIGARAVGPSEERRFVTPRTSFEQWLADLWKQVLQIDRVGIESTFFDLGGNSIQAAILTNLLQERLGEEVGVGILFDHPTVERLAVALETRYPAAASRHGGGRMSVTEPTTRVDAEAIERMRRMVRPGSARPRKNPRAVFVLSPPGSGVAWLGAILAGYPGLFVPPELELLGFLTLRERRAALAGDDWRVDGAVAAFDATCGCGLDEARRQMEGYEARGLTVRELYRELQRELAGRILVELTTSYALDPEALRRCEEYFEEPLYIHLLRHPCAAVVACEKEGLERTLFAAEPGIPPRQLAGMAWTVGHENIREFLRGIPPHRQKAVKLETLSASPHRELGEICAFLELDPALPVPTAEMRDDWRGRMSEQELGDVTRELAETLGYDLSSRRESAQAAAVSIVRPGRLPLSFAQQRLWFLEQLAPGTATYNVQVALRLNGRLDPGALAGALEALVARHEVLRTSFPALDGEPVQEISPTGAALLSRIDLAVLPEALRARTAQWIAREEAARPFDLERGPLLRALLIGLEEEKHALVLTLHHVVCDGWSMGILVRETGTLYSDLAQGRRPSLPPLPLQYADFSLWQRERLSGALLEDLLGFWRERLAGVPTLLALPFDRPRPAAPDGRGAKVRASLAAPLATAAAALGQVRGATLFVVLLASFESLLSRLTGQEDLVVGSPSAGRTRPEIEGLIGFFVNTLPLRGTFTGDPGFADVVVRTRDTVFAALAHQDLPFERLIEALQLERSSSHPPLVQVMFALQSSSTDREGSLELPGLVLEPLDDAGFGSPAKFDLSVSLIETPGGLAGAWEYDPALFDPATVARMAGALEALVAGVVERPEARLSELPLLSPAQRHQLVAEWNDTAVPCDGRCVHELFAEQARRTPGAVAVVAGEELSYRELDHRANRLAHRLRSLGVRPGVLVGLCLDRTAELVVGLLGILKAGGAYVPLDPGYPRERLAFMAHDAALGALVSTSDLAALLPQTGAPVAFLDLPAEQLTARDETPPTEGAGPGDPAYVIYTSGSTGQPKGVLVEHRSLAHTLAASLQAFGWQAGDAMPVMAPLSFDIFLFELLSPLLTGGRCHLIRLAPAPDLEELLGLLPGLTRIHAVPALMRQIVRGARDRGAAGRPLTTLFVGGDVVPPDLLAEMRAAFPAAELRVLYGPTEGTIIASSWHAPAGVEPVRSLLGRPLPGVELTVCDRFGGPAPIGVAGEIWIGGPGVARGYLSREDLTAGKFVVHAGARYYRTGDLARWRAQGELEFLGRLDGQVKVRGFRIEPGEIEATLSSHPEVREAVVTVREDLPGDRRLVAYVVPAGGSPDPGELRSWLQSRLPPYMVPASFVALPDLPLTAHGKVDRKALPAPERPARRERKVVPHTEVERLLTRIWEEVLGLEGIGVDDNFFELGGDSIQSIQVVARAAREGCRITPRQIFAHQTIAELAAVAESGEGITATQRAVLGEVLLTPIQRGFFESAPVEAHHFNQSLLLRPRGALAPAAVETAVRHLVAHHDALRLRFAPSAAGWRQWSAAPREGSEIWTRIDLRSAGILSGAALEDCAAQVQASLDLAAGPLARAVWLDLPAGEARLLMVVHHLAVDGVSWRILLEDLDSACRQASRGEAVRLPLKTISFQAWSQRLAEHAGAMPVEPELSWWLRETGDVAILPLDHPAGANTEGSVRRTSTSLTAEETGWLLREAPAAYRTQINDLLLTALARTFAGASGALAVDLEGHGREEIASGQDLSRTVGWLTSLFPVRLEALPDEEPGTSLKRIKEHLRAIPGHGIGYGLLRHLRDDATVEPLRRSPAPRIGFNYLGQLDQVLAGDALFEPASEPSGPAASPRALRAHLLDVVVRVAGGRLWADWLYSSNLHDLATVEQWAGLYAERLRELIAHCRNRVALGLRSFTPSDFPLARLEQGELDRLLAIVPEMEDLYPLSPLQQGMLFHALYAPGSGVYVEQLACRLDGDFDAEAFENACKRLLERHPVLRTSFHWDGLPRPLAAVQARVASPVERLDWSAVPESQQEECLRDLLRADRARGFDLTRSPLMRWTLIETGGGEHRLLWTQHHILLDGWSFGALAAELLSAYEALRSGEEPRFASRRPYREYIAWLERQDLARTEAYWRRTLAGWSGPLSLGRETPAGQPGLERLEIPWRRVPALQEQARRHQLTLNTLVQAAWGLLLCAHAGQEEVVFGATVSGRPADLPGVESMVGLFINTLPVRLRADASQDLLGWLRAQQLAQAELRQHEHAPLVRIQEWSEAPRGRALFETLFVFENYPRERALGEPAGRLRIGDLLALEETNFPLSLVVIPDADLILRVAYERARFDRITVTRMLGQMGHLLDELLAGLAVVGRRVGDLSPLTGAERHQLLVDWNDTVRPYGDGLRLDALVARQAERTPDSVAVVFAAKEMSYAELQARACQVARHLQRRGVAPGDRVAVCMERSLDLMVALLGILAAGAAYAPLDPTHPERRLAGLLEDLGRPLVLTEEGLRKRLPEDAQTLRLDVDWPAIARENADAPTPGVPGGATPAYVIYTSGSTGMPKGAINSHRAIVNRLLWMQDRYELCEKDAVLQKTPYGFDVSVWELFWPLITGARLVMAPPDAHRDAAQLVDLITAAGITTVHFVPSMLRVFLEQEAVERCASLRRVICSGEALPFDLQERFFTRLSGAELHNLYGPTEAAVDVTSHACAPGDERGIVPIGRPISNLRCYIVDPGLRPAPLGVAGELLIGGVGLGTGYLGRPDLTAERFVPDPFSGGRGERLYRTGDLCRHLPEGAVEFLGRLDFQVKIHGVRIELGEVEAALLAIPGVLDALVVAREDLPGGWGLAGFVVPAPGEERLTENGMRSLLRERLPEPLVPARLVLIPEMPRSSSGKVDRKSLTRLPIGSGSPSSTGAPRTPSEEIVAGIFMEVLGSGEVGAGDSFFDLGGHSLLATQVVSRLRGAFGIEIVLRELFEAPTPERLAARVDQALARERGPVAPPIARAPRTGNIPLSFGQERFWFLDRLVPGSPLYNIPLALRLRGALEASLLAASLDAVVARHESLRTRFTTIGGRPVQVVVEAKRVPLPLIDLSGLPADRRETTAALLAKEEAALPFDLERGPVLRASLLRLAEDLHVGLFTMHHIASDAWSMGVLVREISDIFAALGRGERPSLPELPLQYADFSVWQREWLTGDGLGRLLAYWWQRMEGAPALLQLPLDRPRPAAQGFQGARLYVRLPGKLGAEAAALGRARGATAFMSLLGALTAWLARVTGQEDLVVGSPVAGRDRLEIEGLIGLFVNTVVLRTDLTADPGFAELLDRVREGALEAYAHQDLPFDLLVDELQPERSLGYSPLFQVMFELQNVRVGNLGLPGVAVELFDSGWQGNAKFDLTITYEENPQGLTGIWEYDPALFDATTVARWAGQLETLLAGAVEAPERRLSELPLLSVAERRQLLDWNDTGLELPRDRCLHELFEEQVERMPDALALVSDLGELTYRELNRRANRIAHYLQALGVRPDLPVGISMRRTPDLIAGIFGILKSGAAYLPLDADYPQDRLAFMLEDSGVEIVLADPSSQAKLPAHPDCSIHLLAGEAIAGQSAENPQPRALPANLAYVMYTSGSTGRPKGVMVAHRNASWLAANGTHAYGFSSRDRVLQFATVSFDISVQEIFSTLVCGATLVLATDDMMVPARFLGRCRELEVSVLALATVFWHELSLEISLRPESLPRSLCRVLIGGEKVMPGRVIAWRRAVSPDVQLFNTYGPTEGSVDAAYHRVVADPVDELSDVPLGRPLPNARIHILDRAFSLVGSGVIGELCIGGWGVARGYLDRPELTAERFIPDPFSPDPGERLYRTGDLARHRSDGELEFVGREDGQVKIRGFRVEPGEIESVLSSHPGVGAVAVLVREDSPGDRRLAAYVVPRAEDLVLPELRTWLEERLPRYMVPSAWMALDALPLTPNGKLDRAALPVPERGAGRESYVPPRTAVEELLVSVWQQVLGIEKVGIYDNFFELGGDSILSLQVVALAARGDCQITPRQMFSHQTIAELATLAEAVAPVERRREEAAGEVPLTPIQLWYLTGSPSSPHHFNMSMMLRVREAVPADVLEWALTRLIEHHDALRLRLAPDPDAGGRWRQWYAGENAPGSTWTRVDLTLAGERAREAVEVLSAQAQGSLDLGSGPLVRGIGYDLPAGERRLLLVVHHLVVDAISWRVLLEDLESLCLSGMRGELPALPPKTASFKSWAERLVEQARIMQLEPELSWWRRELEELADPLPIDDSDGSNSEESTRRVTVSLSAEETRALLQDVPAAYRAQINDALLTALARTLAVRHGIRIDLEGHGREDLFAGVDLTRTVGWFTTMFPVRLEIVPGEDPGRSLQRIKEHLRGIPRRGIGYGLLRYLREDTALAGASGARVSFNYLGQLDGSGRAPAPSGGPLFEGAGEWTGPLSSPRASRSHDLEIVGLVAGGCLRIDWLYSQNLHRRSSIEEWAAAFLNHLRTLISHCQARLEKGLVGYTASDFPLAGLTAEELERALGGQMGIEDLYPLSPLQEGMLFHSVFAPRSGVYVEQQVCRLRGDLDLKALAGACRALLGGHPILRSSFHWQGLPKPLQAVHARVPLELEIEDWQDLPEAAWRERLERLLAADRERGFDLAHAPLTRWTVIRTRALEHWLLWTHHHLLLDGWSYNAVAAELLAGYAALRNGEEPRLTPRRPFRDYIAWLEERDLAQTEAYWRRTLAGWTEPTPLTIGREAGGEEGGTGDHEIVWTPEATSELQEQARQHQLTVNTVVQAAWGLLLHRYSGRQDVVFGTTVSGRPPELAGADSMVGLFINTLPVRMRWEGGERLSAWLRGLQLQHSELRQHEHTPLVRIQEWCEAPRGRALFESFFVFENFPRETALSQGGPRLDVDESRAIEQSNYPLAVLAAPGERLLLRISYARSRFEPAEVRRMLEHLSILLAGMTARLAADNEDLEGISLLSRAERHQLLLEWGTARPLPVPESLLEAFAAQARTRPDAVALVCRDVEMTYSELARRAGRLASSLRRRGIGPGEPVGLCVERSPEMVVGILGILAAGGVFVPLDPAYPSSRLDFMATDSGAGLVLAQSELLRNPPEWGNQARWMDLDEELARLEPAEDEAVPTKAGWQDAAYLIYTSGTTGRPKAVVVEHGSLLSTLAAAQAEFGWREGDRMPCLAPFSFDIFLLELCGPLLAGGTVELMPLRPALDLDALIDGLPGATQLHAVPALMRQLVDRARARGGVACPRLRTVFVGGDSVPAPLLADLLEIFPGAQVRVLYGPTEGTIICSSYAVPRSGPPLPLLGHPLPNVELRLCDAAGRPVSAGVTGEICIGGPGVSREYLNRPDLTAERYVRIDGRRFFRTGDQARYLKDGTLEFLGRADGQVKLRGLRIELGEIESVLSGHPDVGEVVAVIREDIPGERQLVAYMRTREPERDSGDLEQELRSLAQRHLPDYMVPSAFVRLAALPLTPHGKVDRSSLPRPWNTREVAAREYVAPRTALEAELAGIWESILNVRPIGIRSSFFDLGGHSLLSLQLLTEVKNRFGRGLPLEVLFEEPTVEHLAAWLGGWAEEGEWAGGGPLVTLQAEGTDAPLFCVHPAGGGVQCYIALAGHLGTSQPFYGLQAREIDDESLDPQSSIEEMAATYLEVVRGVQPIGPYRIGGWSYGGMIAFEMAQQLARAGEQVALLALIDATPPGEGVGSAPTSAELIVDLLVSLHPTVQPVLAVADLEGLPLEEQLACAGEALRLAGVSGPAADLGVLRRRWDGVLARRQARQGYRARPYTGPIFLFRPEEVIRSPQGTTSTQEDPVRFWSSLALGGIEVVHVPGRHETMCREPHVRSLAGALARALARVRTEGPGGSR